MGPEHRERLLRDGYTVVPEVLDPEMLRRLRATFSSQVAGLWFNPEIEAPTQPFTPGTPDYRTLIAWPPALYALHAMGFRDVRWWGGAVIPKPAGEGRRSYHQDWWGWQYPESLRPEPMQLGLLYYLQDTAADTGALAVIPGSHCQEKPIHSGRMCGGEQAEWDGTREIRAGYLQDHLTATTENPAEVVVTARAGDLVILDARTMHASRQHVGPALRMLLTLWYMVGYEQLPEGVQAYTARSVGAGTSEFLGTLCPSYHGRERPCPQNCFPVWVAQHGLRNAEILREGR